MQSHKILTPPDIVLHLSIGLNTLTKKNFATSRPSLIFHDSCVGFVLFSYFFLALGFGKVFYLAWIFGGFLFVFWFSFWQLVCAMNC